MRVLEYASVTFKLHSFFKLQIKTQPYVQTHKKGMEKKLQFIQVLKTYKNSNQLVSKNGPSNR